MNKLDRCIEIIGELEKYSRSERCDFEVTPEVLRELTTFFEECSDGDRDFIRGFLSGTKAGLALVFKGTNAAEMAIDTGNSDWIKVAILAHIIEGFKWDPRENMREFLFLSYSANKIHADLKKIFSKIKHLSAPHALSYLEKFSNGKNKINKSDLNTHGFQEKSINNRTKFVSL